MNNKQQNGRKPLRVASTAAALTLALSSQAALACSGEAYIGSICATAATFCPRGTAEANGQLLAITSSTALFSLIGANYGGDGRTTFGLPDLRGRAPIGLGVGPGLSNIAQGQKGGTESITLAAGNLPSHTHSAALNGADVAGTETSVSNASLANLRGAYASGAPTTAMQAGSVSVESTGSSQAVPSRSPYQGVRYCIVTEGIFPSRS